ncbi:HlyD family efflux transporter periplasmic adaptor subunit [Lutibacter sp.]|uniref:HlyD family secretion protein n=1 Tax=Lutibacter sp. TaxID=1925666 RepID=UPI0025C2932D|nr:HlyD family efflux transporter periplasmic adaptor subunit [Lutibacter sp.]MCF6168468.1 HlyD family secretion protein [Lutibacter sp.]
MKNIFPKEILENTTQVHQFKHSKKSSIIYTTFLIALIGAFISLPFIKVDVYTSSRGLLKPEKERINLSTIYAGKVLKNNIQTNKYVSKGDTLLILDDHTLTNKLQLINFNITETQQFLHDINYLLHNNRIRLDSLYSQKYHKEYIQYKDKLQELQTRFKKAKRDYFRNKKLFEKGVIAAVEIENYKFDYDLIINVISQFRKQQLNTWQADLTLKSRQLNELENSSKLQNENKDYYILKAPTNGTLMNVIGIEEGSIINANIPLAEISPDGNLIAECYVSPIDIGLINPNSTVKFQMDAFNYNQWGLATGKIIEIGKDIELNNETPIFKIRCKIDQKYLTLKNNFKGTLKKGMTFNARFKLTERTLFELLYDKIDDWLNPSNQSIG